MRASSICGGCPAELVHADRSRRQACADALKRHLDYAAELGAVGPITVPIFNSNERVSDMSPWKSRGELEKELLLAMLQTVIPHAEQVGAAILLEPLNRYEFNSLPKQKDGAAIVRTLNSKSVRLMSDVFHMHIEETNSPATLRDVADCIGHVHLADNTRQEPGTGDIDFGAIMAALVRDRIHRLYGLRMRPLRSRRSGPAEERRVLETVPGGIGKSNVMNVSPLAGKPAPESILVDIPALITAYYTELPDPGVAAQKVAFGTSGHRGSSFDRSFNEKHILAITQAICLYRKQEGTDGPLYLGMDTHALSTACPGDGVGSAGGERGRGPDRAEQRIYPHSRHLPRHPDLQSRPHNRTGRRHCYHAVSQPAIGRRI